MPQVTQLGGIEPTFYLGVQASRVCILAYDKKKQVCLSTQAVQMGIWWDMERVFIL